MEIIAVQLNYAGVTLLRGGVRMCTGAILQRYVHTGLLKILRAIDRWYIPTEETFAVAERSREFHVLGFRHGDKLVCRGKCIS